MKHTAQHRFTANGKYYVTTEIDGLARTVTGWRVNKHSKRFYRDEFRVFTLDEIEFAHADGLHFVERIMEKECSQSS